jgi:hypothetical protein
MADDFSNDINTIGKITIGGSKTGNFETYYDNDWFKVTLTAGTTYLFTLAGAPDGGGTLSSYAGLSLAMMAPQGYSLSYSNYNGTSAPVLQYTPQTSGTYFVAAVGTYGQVGTYTIKSSFPAADDYAAAASTTGALGAEVTASGAFERTDDADWFRFHADAGQITTFTADNGAGMVVPQTFNVYDSAGRAVSYLQAQSAFTAGLGGDYFVGVNAGGQIGNYAVTMHVATDDYSSDNTRAGSLYAGGQATGTLDYRDDSDRFHLDVQAGQFYTVSLSTTTAGSHQLNLSVTDGTGGYVAATGGTNVDGSLTLRILAAGTGTLSFNVSDYYSTSAGTVYTLKASPGEADDFGGTMASATALDFGAPLSGKVQSRDDIDMFKIGLTAGVTYRVDLAMDDISPYYGFRMTDSGGNSVSQSSLNTDKFFTYAPTKSGDFYLSLGSYVLNTSGQAYTVAVSAPADDFSANTATTGRLAVGASAKGELEAGGGDADWYAVSLNAGGYYWFSVDGAKEGGGTLSNYSTGALMRVLDAKGAVMATGSGGYNATSIVMPFAAPAKGTYYLEVSSPGAAGTYTVKARVGEVDDYGNDAAHAAAMTAGAAVKGKLELTSDTDMFKLTAEAGVTYKLQLAPGAAGGLNVNSYATLDVSGANEYVYARTQYDSPNQITKVFEASTSGDYYFKIGTSIYGSAGTYVLTATSLGKDDFPASNLTTGLLAPDAPVHGVIGVADDHDWIKVHLDAGRTYVFDLQGTLSGGGTLVTANSSVGMTLTSANGYNGVYSTTVAGEPRISYIAAASGDYYLDVHGDGGKTGSYTVVETMTNGDVTPPHLLASTLRDGAANVSPVAPKFTLTYDEAVLVGNGITLTDALGTTLVPTGYGQALAMGLGKTLVIDPHLNLRPGMAYTLTLPEGSVLDLAGNQVAGSQVYKFTTAEAVGRGTAGNDFLIGTMKGLKLDGGAGIDTVYYDSASVYYGLQLTHNADGSFSVRDYTQSAGDTLSGVERLLLPTSAMALDIDGNGGQAYRLYQAAFNRAPGSGLGFWMNALDGGVKLETVAQNFIDSAEFKTLYGDVQSNADFVTHLYSNVLHRAPLQAGLDFWTHALDAGSTRAQILVNFSESAENVAALQPLIGQGFTYTPYG